MNSKIKSQEQLSIVTMAEAKGQLNIIDSNDDDAHIQLLIDSCSELAEGYTKRLLSQGVVELVFFGKISVRLPYGEATEEDTPIVATVAGDPISFEFDDISQMLTITDANVRSTDKVKVTYSAGYKKVPNSVKLGVLMMISSVYENREDSVAGLTVENIPLNSMAILNRVRLENI